MGKRAILVISFVLIGLITGIVMGDTGINATSETQGFHTSTTIIAVGSFSSTTDVAMTSTTSEGGLTEVPPISGNGALYQAVYTEDTNSGGIGEIRYDKELIVDTGAKLTGQSNIEATKQLSFVGYNGSRVHSAETIMVSGTANPSTTSDKLICIFGNSVSGSIPAYCNYVSAGSSIDMSVANVLTTTNARFIVASSDTPVELSHTIRVTDREDIPSRGKVSTFMEGMIFEGRGNDMGLYEKIELNERTSVDGFITLFNKEMSYLSGVKR
ncbi:MAG TPA: hypothetical protein PKZ57_04150 [Methanoregulaceae archaeon]|nr:hypothetical protein [Methanoregulaceae archaeon]HQM56677.1 hypothetical protein [Methanoregulaceae archaeon]